MSLKSPKVMVLMPVYNGEKYIKDAVDSILSQTYRDFEFLIINDGSTDGSMEVLKTYKDPRIHIVHNEKNLGVILTLNKGIDLAQGEYIARMDCDDISLPERLEKQVSFMDAHPEIAACGTWLETMDTRESILRYPVAPDIIKCRLLFENSMAHPSTIIRTHILREDNLRYDPDYKHAEDYQFWVKISRRHLLTNIDEVLYRYRIHDKNVSVVHKGVQLDSANKVRKGQLMDLGIEATEEKLALHSDISMWKSQISEEFLSKAHGWLTEIQKANERSRIYNPQTLQGELARRWYAMCSKAATRGLKTWRIFYDSPLGDSMQKIKLLLKCGLKYGGEN